MSKTVEAVYENGVFKPVVPIDMPEHKKLFLVIEEETEVSAEILSLASNVYKGFSAKDIEDVEKVALDRSHFSRD